MHTAIAVWFSCLGPDWSVSGPGYFSLMNSFAAPR